jgi:hypothetical protein
MLRLRLCKGFVELKSRYFVITSHLDVSSNLPNLFGVSKNAFFSIVYIYTLTVTLLLNQEPDTIYPNFLGTLLIDINLCERKRSVDGLICRNNGAKR